jgi:hypothetical protein
VSDGKKMRTFLEDSWGFDIDILYDKDISKIEAKFEEYIADAKAASKFKSKVLFFVYYSGHGTH